MNYKVDTSMIPRVSYLRVCLSCWSRLPAVRTSQNSISSMTCSPNCGTVWLRSLSRQTVSSVYSKALERTDPSRTPRRYCSSDETKEAEQKVQKNPYFEKYKGKIQSMQSSQPEEFASRIGELQERLTASKQQRKKDLTQPPSNEKSSETSSVSWPPKSLDDIMKTELLVAKSASEIEKIWKEYHVDKDCVFGIVKEIDYDHLMEKARICPVIYESDTLNLIIEENLFVYPLPRNDGFEFILSQFNGKDIYFTPLIMYQAQKENAVSCLTVAHFPEMKEKGIVLMAGRHDSGMLSKEDALNLVRQMTMYYSTPGAERFNLVRIFNHTPEKFKYQDIITEYKKMKFFLEKAFFDS